VLTIPVTSKTGLEVLHLGPEMPRFPAAVAEGGAVIVTADGRSEILGAPRDRLIEILHRLQSEGWSIVGFSDLTCAHVAELTGLPPSGAKRALQRLASEPFTEGGGAPLDGQALRRRASELGGEVTRGGRLWHLLGRGIDKGRGARAVLERLGLAEEVATAAVGDALNDLSMLIEVEFGYLLGDGVPDSEIPAGVCRIPSLGPEGFLEAARLFARRF
jgi:mannosyl-3-phosphoglycerate phosphatase